MSVNGIGLYLQLYMQGKMTKQRKKRVLAPDYVSPKQLTFEGFETPFAQSFNPKNRWVVLAKLIPRDEICNLYRKHVGVSNTGRPPINPRVVIGSAIIKHMCNLDDRETLEQIAENTYMQYLLGYSGFTNEPPFDASLFVEFRKRLGFEQLKAINERIILLKAQLDAQCDSNRPKQNNGKDSTSGSKNDQSLSGEDEIPLFDAALQNRGRLLMDATACPQDIAFPTDLDLLSSAREKSESMIACIVLVLNLVILAGVSALCLIVKSVESFSAMCLANSIWIQPLRISNKGMFDNFNNTKRFAA